MRTWVFEQYGGRITQAERSRPYPGPEEVLIKVEAAGLNQLDLKIIGGEFKQILPYELPQGIGHDLAGVVVEVGDNVTRFVVGDLVFSRVAGEKMGTVAEYVAVAAQDVAIRPANLTPAEAATLPLVALTAWQALVELGQVGAGSRVLIHAGGGAVGSVAIQLAKHLGAEVATTVSAKDEAFVRELGADLVIDYRNQEFSELLTDYDLVLDSVGGENVAKSLRVLRPGGKVIGISGPPDPAFAQAAGLGVALRAAIAATSLKIRRAAKKLGVHYQFLFMRPDGDQLAQLGELVRQGKIRPTLGRVFPFDEAPLALEEVGSRKQRGKVVIAAPDASEIKSADAFSSNAG